MSFRLRALRALALLAGFHLLGAALLAAMAALDLLLVTRWLTERAALFEGAVLTGTVLLAVAVLRGTAVAVRAGRLEPLPEAVPVAAPDQPELWAEVRAAAAATGERPPDELYLVDGVVAGVAEQGRLLGLLPGRRRMLLGLPLLAGLTVPQLRAVLAHEFGHCRNGDTRLGGPTMRGRRAVLHTVAVLERGGTWAHRAVARPYAAYARLFLRASQSVAREQEAAADLVAVRYAGRGATLSALRDTPVLTAAYAHYLRTYAGMAARQGALPPAGEVYGGFRRLLAARSGTALAALRGEGPAPRPHPYDSHPPLAERVALVEGLPADGADAPAEAAGVAEGALSPASALLRDPDGLFAALEARLLPPQDTAPMRRAGWDELVTVRAVADAEGWSEPLRLAVARALRPGAPAADAPLPDLAEVLDAFDRGLLWDEVADRLPKPPQAARLTGASARNFVRPRVFDALAGLVHLRLLAAGLAAPDVAWSGRPGLALPEAWERGMDDALDAATADTPDTGPLRALLAATAATAATAVTV